MTTLVINIELSQMVYKMRVLIHQRLVQGTD